MEISTPNGRYEPDEVLELATAIAQREIFEQEYAAPTTGEAQDQLPPEIRQSYVIAQTAIAMRSLEDSGYVPSTAEAVGQFDIGALIEHHAGADVANKIDKEQIRTQLVGLIDGLVASMSKGANTGFHEKARERFSHLLQAAGEVAIEHDVSLPDVYRDEAMYIEAASRAQTAEEFVSGVLNALDVPRKMITQGLMQHMQDKMISAGRQKELNERFFADLQLDPDFQAAVSRSMAGLEEPINRSTVSKVTRIWGSEALEKLSPEMRDRLGIGRTNTGGQ